MKKLKIKHTKRNKPYFRLFILLFMLPFLFNNCENEQITASDNGHIEEKHSSNQNLKTIDYNLFKQEPSAQKFIDDVGLYIANNDYENNRLSSLNLTHILQEKATDGSLKYYFKFQQKEEDSITSKNLIVAILPDKKYYMRIVTFQNEQIQNNQMFMLINTEFITLKDLQDSILNKKSLYAKTSNCFDLDDFLKPCYSIMPYIIYYACNNGYTDYHESRRDISNNYCTGSLAWQLENPEYTSCINRAQQEYQDLLINSAEYSGDPCDYYNDVYGNGNNFDEGNNNTTPTSPMILEDGTIIGSSPYVKYPPNSNYETLYPKLTEYLINQLPTIKNNSTIISAIKKYTNLSTTQIQQHLQWGHGPTIRIEQLGTAYGKFKKNADPNSLYLDIDLVNQLENTTPNSSLANAFAFLIGVTVLHEYVHYGDYNYNRDTWQYPQEEGLLFENDVYGQSVWIHNAEIILKNN